METTEREIAGDRFAAMFPGNDVIDFKWNLIALLRNSAILATVAGT